ncbi:hypothetical protein PPERSA_11322 [Pseudocohnilembus persalinus]|uniref:Chromatin assembly factor 1 subunit A dimerization domain-containing protein n=1 Tax=Pseudocohnilembus persalinus TaxID=266149 RepID=A0A0V0QPN3_PSEPJ|nr:hypothetical protein PPERSA_11322 [Pseudocohnilembus persalinus]|eukprot:KRX04198.1 hypothetical protein PPERSA_11322 [Pseudocohnilembus persalinus]
MQVETQTQQQNNIQQQLSLEQKQLIFDKIKFIVEKLEYSEFIPQIGFEIKDYGYQNNIAIPVENEQPHKIMEVKISDLQNYTDEIDEIKYVRNLRKLKKDVLTQLNKLIKQIQKTKKEDDVKKIDEIFTKFQQAKAKRNNPPPKSVKKSKKMIQKALKQQQQQNQDNSAIKNNSTNNSSDLSDSGNNKSAKKIKKVKNTKIIGEEESIEKDLKKVKINSSNATPDKNRKNSKSKSPDNKGNESVKKQIAKKEEKMNKITKFFQIKPQKKEFQEDLFQPIQVASQQNNNLTQLQNVQQGRNFLQNNDNNMDVIKVQPSDIPFENQIQKAQLNTSINVEKNQVNLSKLPEKKEKKFFRTIGQNTFLLGRTFESQQSLEEFENILKGYENQQKLYDDQFTDPQNLFRMAVKQCNSQKEQFQFQLKMKKKQMNKANSLLNQQQQLQQQTQNKNKMEEENEDGTQNQIKQNDNNIEETQQNKSQNPQIKGRRIYISMHDSQLSYKNVIFTKTSKILNPIQPFQRDDEAIDYEIDSDEELEVAMGDNVDDEDGEEEESMDESRCEGLVVVSDGHLSDGEGDPSDEEGIGKQDYKISQENYNIKFEKKLAQIKNQEDNSYCFVFNNLNEAQKQNPKIMNLFQQSSLKIVEDNYVLPLKMKKDEKLKELQKQSDPFHSSPIDETQAFIKLLHGSYLSQIDIINQFTQLYPNKYIKSQLKKKIQEITSKEKIENEKVKKFIVYKSYFNKLGCFSEEDYDQILLEKKEEQDKKYEDKKIQREKEKKEKEEIKKKEKEEQLLQQQQQNLQQQQNQQTHNIQPIDKLFQQQNEKLKQKYIKMEEEQDCQIIIEEINEREDENLANLQMGLPNQEHNESFKNEGVNEDIQGKLDQDPENKQIESNKQKTLLSFFKKVDNNQSKSPNKSKINDKQQQNLDQQQDKQKPKSSLKPSLKTKVLENKQVIDQTESSKKKSKSKKDSKNKEKLEKQEKQENKDLKQNNIDKSIQSLLKEIDPREIVPSGQKRIRKPAPRQFHIDEINVSSDDDEDEFENDGLNHDGSSMDEDEEQEFEQEDLNENKMIVE